MLLTSQHPAPIPPSCITPPWRRASEQNTVGVAAAALVPRSPWRRGGRKGEGGGRGGGGEKKRDIHRHNPNLTTQFAPSSEQWRKEQEHSSTAVIFFLTTDSFLSRQRAETEPLCCVLVTYIRKVIRCWFDSTGALWWVLLGDSTVRGWYPGTCSLQPHAQGTIFLSQAIDGCRIWFQDMFMKNVFNFFEPFRVSSVFGFLVSKKSFNVNPNFFAKIHYGY